MSWRWVIGSAVLIQRCKGWVACCDQQTQGQSSVARGGGSSGRRLTVARRVAAAQVTGSVAVRPGRAFPTCSSILKELQAARAAVKQVGLRRLSTLHGRAPRRADRVFRLPRFCPKALGRRKPFHRRVPTGKGELANVTQPEPRSWGLHRALIIPTVQQFSSTTPAAAGCGNPPLGPL